MKEVGDFKLLVKSVVQKKGRMNAGERNKASLLIATILNNFEEPLGDVLPLFEELQSEAVANGIGIAWPNLLSGRRLEIRRWVPPPRTERAQRRVALLAAKLMETDGITALDLLDKLVPDHRPNKELSRLLTSALFAKGQTPSFENLYASASPNTSLRVISALCALAFNAGTAIEPIARYRLSLAALKLLVKHKLEQTGVGADLLSRIAIEVARWPQRLREQFGSWLESEAPLLSQEFFPPKGPAASGSAQKRPEDIKQESNQEIMPSTIEHYLEHRVQALAAESQMLSQVSAFLASSRVEMERQASASKAKESELNKRLHELNTVRFALEKDLKNAKRRISELEDVLKNSEQEKVVEHERLTQQIAANANGRVAEFKNQIAHTLSKQMIDLPTRDTEVNAELGRVLLLQFHQLVQILEELGIRLHTVRSVR